MTSRAKRLMLLVGVAPLLVVVGGCGGGGGPDPGSTGDVGLAPIETTAGGQARVIIGFKDAPGNSEQALVRRSGGKVKRAYHLIPAMAATVPAAAIDGLRNNPNVTYIEGDHELRALEDVLGWGPDRIDAEVVWGRAENAVDIRANGPTGAGVRVALIDTGVDYTHPDLDDNYVGGYDFVNNDDDPMDDQGHGTMCAGVLAAEDNGESTIGVAPEAALYGVKVLNQQGAGPTSNLIAALEWCVDNNMQVASMSLGGYGESPSLAAACDAAFAANIVLVAAAGNSGTEKGLGGPVEEPGSHESVIAVAATNPVDLRADFSATGPEVELAAPGRAIYTSTLGNGYGAFSGTSAATPHVAGVAALVVSAGITSASEVRAKLQLTAEDMGDPGRDPWYGFGMVDAVAATGALPAPPGSETGDLVGVVIDAANGRGIEGATVTMTDTGQSFVSRFNGRYTVLDVPPGTHTVTCSMGGYHTAMETVEIPPDQTVWLEFALVPQ